MLERLLRPFRRASERPSGREPRPAEGERVYAVGDIHGRLDLLQQLHALIRADSETRPPAARQTVVYLGDYVDRGHQSRDVVDELLADPLAGFETVHLKGNHEDVFMRFLDDVTLGPSWFSFGGSATALSYGVTLPPTGDDLSRFEAVRQKLLRQVPQAHVDFLTGLPVSHLSGDYFFAHAGVRPGRPLAEQSPDDLLWIRDEFLRRRDDFGAVVVHGHSISGQPDVRANRIGIDTGAYATNTLTCLVLEGTSQRFLRTK